MRRVVYAISTVLLLLLLGCQKEPANQEPKHEITKFAGKDDISAILYMETDITEIDTCIVTSWENRMYAFNLIPNRYIWMEEVVGEAETIETPLGNAYNYFYSTYTVNLYSIEEGKVVKTYAIEEMEEALPEGYRIYDNFGCVLFGKKARIICFLV